MKISPLRTILMTPHNHPQPSPTRILHLASPWGGWRLVSNSDFILALDWLPTLTAFHPLSGPDLYGEISPTDSHPPTPLERLVLEKLHRYFEGQPVDFAEVPVQLVGTAFQQQVWRQLAHIPYGETRSYQWLARQIGRPKATRAVGSALGRNPLPILLPCHRVITSTGGLGGFRSGCKAEDLTLKEWLLGLEGLTVPLTDSPRRNLGMG